MLNTSSIQFRDHRIAFTTPYTYMFKTKIPIQRWVAKSVLRLWRMSDMRGGRGQVWSWTPRHHHNDGLTIASNFYPSVINSRGVPGRVHGTGLKVVLNFINFHNGEGWMNNNLGKGLNASSRRCFDDSYLIWLIIQWIDKIFTVSTKWWCPHKRGRGVRPGSRLTGGMTPTSIWIRIQIPA